MHENNNIDNKDDQEIDSVPFFKKKSIMIPVIVTLLLAAAGWYWYKSNQGYISTDDAFVDSDKFTVSSKIPGRVVLLSAGEGDTVKQGGILTVLDTIDLKAQEQQAVASLNSTQESISLSKVSLERAEDDFNRAKAQYESGIMPKEQYVHAQNTLNAAHAEYNVALTKVGTAQAQINVIRTQLKNCVIYSPTNGVVARKWISQGDVIQPGQAVFTIYNLDDIWVTAELEETKLGSIKENAPVEIDVDAYPDVKFTGKVIQIGTYTASQFSLIPPNNASGNFTKVTQRVPVKILVNDPHKSYIHLLPGMSVEVRVKEG